jgi:hypothetical protein
VSLVASTLLAGCIESGRFAWAPDGSQAALCAVDGLRFCDPTGKLSDTQMKTPDELAWHPDGKRLLVVTHIEGVSWDDLAPQLPAQRRQLVESEAALFLKFAQQPGVTPAEFGKNMQGKITRDAISEILPYLKAKHDAELKDLFGKDWTNYTVNPSALYTLASYRPAGDKLTDEKILWKSTKSLNSPRVSPTSADMLVVHDSRNLYLLRENAEPVLLVEGVSKYPDWSSDGKFAYFALESDDDGTPDTVSRIDMTKPTAAGNSEKVTELQYYEDTRVRCLPDGTLLLATATATNKSRPDVFGRKTIYVETFYRLAPGTSKPTQLSVSNEFVNKCGYCSFETSPDAAKVALATENGSIRVVTIAGGASKQVSPDNNAPSPFAPCWRNNEELCYAVGLNPKETSEVVLYNVKTGIRTGISAGWPKTAVSGILVKEEAQQNRFEDFLNAIYQ